MKILLAILAAVLGGTLTSGAALAQAALDARFVSQHVRPLLSPSQSYQVSITMQNTGTTPWTAGSNFYLGSQNPQDNTSWGLSRVALPLFATVLTGKTHTFTFDVTAPAAAGTYDMQWRMLKEGTAWFGATTRNVAVNVASSNTNVNICTGVYADATGATDAAAAIQSCLMLTSSGSSLKLPVGTYLVDNQISITRPVTFGTVSPGLGAAGNCENLPCATLLASPNLHNPPPSGWPQARAVLQISSPDVNINFLAIDGNRNARLYSWAGDRCRLFDNIYGFNVLVLADRVAFKQGLSTRALCASALGWYGSDAVITDSSFVANGSHYTRGVWADGITIGSNDAQILRNRIIDSSDVGMVLMYGKDSLIKGNMIEQNIQPVFGGLVVFRQLDPTGTPLSDGDYSGTVVTENTLECRQNCFIGLHVGARPWQSGESSRVVGVSVHGNTVRDSGFGISASIAGTIAAPVHIYNNTATGAFLNPFTNLCPAGYMNGGSNYNISPGNDTVGMPIDSVIDHHGDTTVYTQQPMCNP